MFISQNILYLPEGVYKLIVNDIYEGIIIIIILKNDILPD